MLTEDKFTGAVKTYMNMVYRLALSYMCDGSAAEDVSQEVFLRLYRSGDRLESPEHMRNWLVRVTINECKRALVSPWRAVGELGEAAEILSSDSSEDRELFEMVMALPKKYRLVLHLHYYEGYSTKELSSLLHIPEATVRSQLLRGRKILKQMLEEAENV